jgi:myo-inositol catabolism protein IolH
MKLAIDPYMFRETPPLELPALVAELGYEWIELSPRDDFIPFFTHARVDDAGVAAFRSALSSPGVGVSSVLPLFRWSGPDDHERQAAVQYWTRAIQIASDLGVDTMNSEFNGNPRQAAVCEAMFWRSMEELLPVFEWEGIRLVLEPHPDDWGEDGKRAVDLIRGSNSPHVSFLHCAPHTFHRGKDCDGVRDKAGDLLTMVHVADAYDHRRRQACATSSTRPARRSRCTSTSTSARARSTSTSSSPVSSASASTASSPRASSPGRTGLVSRAATCATRSAPTSTRGTPRPPSSPPEARHAAYP